MTTTHAVSWRLMTLSTQATNFRGNVGFVLPSWCKGRRQCCGCPTAARLLRHAIGGMTECKYSFCLRRQTNRFDSAVLVFVWAALVESTRVCVSLSSVSVECICVNVSSACVHVSSACACVCSIVRELPVGQILEPSAQQQHTKDGTHCSVSRGSLFVHAFVYVRFRI